MILDYDIKHDACSDEFTGNKVLEVIKGYYWFCPHTERMQKFVYEKFNLSIPVNQYVRVNHDHMMEIKNAISESKKFSGMFGGFYWKDTNHKYID